MLTSRAIEVIRHLAPAGFEAIETPDALLITSPRLSGGIAAEFPVHFEVSPIDGFAVGCVDGRKVRQWLGY